MPIPAKLNDSMDVLGYEIRAFAYETEDLSKVESAISCFVPSGTRICFNWSEIRFWKLGIFSSKFGKKPAQELLNFIATLPDSEKSKINLGEQVDNSGHFYVRFDKQRAYLGDFVIGGLDTVWLNFKLTSYPFSSEKIIAELGDFLGIL